MRMRREPLRRFAATYALIALLAATASALALSPPGYSRTSHRISLVPVQYGGRSVVCEELRQRRMVNQNQMNDRVRNFLLFDAAERGCIELVKALLAEGASVRARDGLGNTALLHAARGGENGVVKLLIEESSDLNHQNIAGSTALLRAVSMNRRRTAKILLEAGADPNIASRRNVSPLIAAAFNGNLQLVELLLDAGARIEPRDATGKSAMVYAAAKGYMGIVRMLLDAGVNVDERYDHDSTALMWASGHTDDVPVAEGLATVELLLKRGAALDLVDDRGRTALMIAAERGHADVVQMLIQAGADLKRRDAGGKTAADLTTNDAVRLLLPGK